MAAPVRLGVIGVGRWGRNYLRTIEAAEGAILARIASRNPETADLVPAACTIDADWRRVAAADDLDGVIIAAPPAAHAEICTVAIDAGMAVLVEKPLTIDVAEAEALLRRAADRGATMMVGHTHLFHPAYQTLKALLPTLGPVRRLRGRAGNNDLYRPDISVLWDWAPHDIAMCLDLVGTAPAEVAARRLATRDVDGVAAERLALDLTFDTGVAAEIQLSTLDEKCRWFAVEARDGVAVYDDLAADKLTLYPADAEPAPGTAAAGGRAVDISPELPLTRVVDAFVAEIGAARPSLDALRLGVEVVKTIARCDARLGE